MEAAEELSLGSNHHIIKGKRTKRQRPQSPIPFSITANSSSGDLLDKDHYDSTPNNNFGFSPTTTTASSAEYYFPDSTEEEEDMANCLILLAQGQSREFLPKQRGAAEEDAALNYAQYSSRKFLEAAATTGGAGKAGYYVYECKTCNRTFPSFQALGGHRASHKKPKNIAMAAEMEKKHQHQQQLQFMLSSDEEESQFKKNSNVYNQLSVQNSRGNSNTNNISNNNNNKSKVHECSICGAEFTSGQALGGHMRRHRAPINGTASTVLSLTPMAMEVGEKQPKKQKAILSLELDLNLPAPEDDHKESKFGFASKQQHHQQQQQKQQQQQSNLVFSAPALVDCHY